MKALRLFLFAPVTFTVAAAVAPRPSESTHLKMIIGVTDDTRELDRDAGTAGLAAAGTAPPGAALVARVNPRSRIRIGDQVEIAVDVDRLHVFDLETSTAIW